MKFEIIDFHTHPFLTNEYNICSHKDYCEMSAQSTIDTMKGLGVTKICGSVISVNKKYANEWEKVKDWNEQALLLKAQYGEFYVPGFHVHPDYVEESLAEIDRMSKLGVKLMGELVPYKTGCSKYKSEGMDEIVKYATEKGMVVSFHSMQDDDMDEFVKTHPDTKLVAAHPNEYREFMRHMERMKMSENYYLDLSGYGMFRHGMLRHAIDVAGVDKILYGSDYPTCNPAMYLGGVLLDELITDEEKKAIFAKNAKKLLGINE